MSTRIYKSQTYRPYKIEVYGLQDDYIGTLQSYDDSFVGRVQDSQVTISKDGTQEFTCSIPRFYINPKTNEKLINPRWEDIINGVLAENTRILKVFVETNGEKKVYPFIVDKITDKRDSHFAVYKEVTGNGLAFAELGKTGLKLELNSRTVELEQEENKDKEIVPTLQYWLDKVFPNVKDKTGKVIKWLTPWCYEIRMDWSYYSDKENRLPNKVYADAYINSWDVKDGALTPVSVSPYQEKARQIDSSENSNKYNITQTLAETFGIFCDYEYKCAENGSFIKEYIDENGDIWQGRKVIFYNRAIKADKPFMMDYQKNLQTISRTCESDEIYTKLYVVPVESSAMTDGYVTIANTEANPLLDEFILNFDYLYEKGAINDYQKEYITKYEKNIHDINSNLIKQAKIIEELTVEINDKQAEEAGYDKSISAAKEELVHYETLRNNEVTNTPITKDKSNSYSVVFVNSGETTEASIRLEGVSCGTISGYTDYKYETKLFDVSNLVAIREKRPITANDKNIYVIVDEDNYAIGLYTAKKNLEQDQTVSEGVNAGYLVYLALKYSPYNKYVDVCNRFESLINKETQKKEEVGLKIQEKQALLDKAIEDQTKLLKQKEALNQKLERILGPALREGYWTPDGYEEIGRKNEVKLLINEKTSSEEFLFDTKLFEEEESGYYYASKEDLVNAKPTYYNYIDISNYYSLWEEGSFGDLVVHLQNPSFKYIAQKDEDLLAGNYFIIHNSTKYYFALSKPLKKNDVLEIRFAYNNSGLQLYLVINDGEHILLTKDGSNFKDPFDVHILFEGINQYLGDYKIYLNAGFIYAFIKKDGKIKPVLLLNNTEINYDIYKQFAYSFDNGQTYETFLPTDVHYNESFEICYPRMAIYKENVNHEADTLIIENTNTEKTLVKFEDYSILLREGLPYFTLKINNNTSIRAILQDTYKLTYYVSQANEILYQDAREVAKENSRPRFTYEVQVSQIPGDIESFELGQLGYISDSELGVHAAQGYISQIVLKLDSPKDDEITIQNYKTKFEDLFSTITASSEAMKQNQHSYDIAASGFTSKGEIDGSILQNTFDSNKIELTYSNTKVHIDDLEGIVLTNTEPYANGVYGQVVLRGGGIFLSNRVDSNDERIWTTGITPNGINASTITTGQLDANLVRIFAGNNLAFQWNSEGLYAYKRDEETNAYLPNTYVRYSDKGLQYLDNGFTAVDLGWNGFAINSQEGSLTLTGKDGLVVYDGLQNDPENPTNHIIRIGKFMEDGATSYGMRLYKPITIDEKVSYTETLITSNDGHLWLKDYIEVGGETTNEEGTTTYGAGVSGLVNSGDNIISGGGASLGESSGSVNTGGAGLSGVGDPNKSVRFWAGSSFDSRDAAPFRVLQDGTCYATSLYIGGDSSINGSSVNDLTAAMNNYNSKLVSSNGNIYNRDNPTQTILFCKALRNGVEMAQLPNGYVLTLEYCERSTGDWFIKYTSLIEGSFNVTVDMDEEYSYRSVLTYVDDKGIRQTILGDTLSFIAVTNGEQGDSIVRIEEQYAASNSITMTPTEWKDTLEETGFSQTKPYLWCKEVYVYTNETTSEPMYRVMAVYGQNGVGIKKLINYYAITNLKTGVEIGNTFWYAVGPDEEYKNIPNTTTFNRYLWHYEKIIFTDDSSTNTSPRIIAVQGTSITEVANQYILSTSNLEILDQEGNIRKEEEWKNSYEAAGTPSAEWPYLWSREVIKYDDGSNPKILSARLMATYGDGIVEIQEYYLLVDTNAAGSLPADWGEPNPTEVPVPNSEARFLWNKERRIYTNGDYNDTQPRIIGMYGEVGDDGRGVLGIIEEYTLSISSTEILPYNTGETDENGEIIIIGGEENWTSTFIMPIKEAPFVWNREGIQYSDNEGEWIYTDPIVITSYVEDGRGIEKLENYYCIYHSAKGVTAGQNGNDYKWFGPDFSKEAIPVPTDENPYLWNYEKIIWTEGDPTITEASVIGSLGISVDDVSEEYAIYNDNKNPPPDNTEEEIYWYSSLQTPTAEKPYLWAKETVTYTSIGKEDKIFKRVIATYTENGKSINEIVNKYLITSDSYSDKEILEIPLEKWEDAPGITTPETPYLWNREIIYYNVDDGNGGYNEKAEFTVTSPRVIGIHGKGEKGNDGISIIDITEEYQYTKTNTPQPGVDDLNWQKNLPLYTLDKPYFWIKETTYYSSIDEETGQNKKDSFVRLVGVNGQVKNIVNYYWANNSSTPPSLETNPLPPNANKDTWTETEQEATSKNRFLWNCEVITYTVPNEKNETSQVFGPILLGSYGEKGDTTYTWIKYSNVANPTSSEEMFDDPEGMTYMGIAYNQLVEKASDNPKDYKWSLIQGPVGNDAIVYEIVFSESSIKRELVEGFIPSQIEVTVRKTEGLTITDITNELGTAEAHENAKYKLYYLPNPNYEPKQYLYSDTVINAQNCYELGEGYQTCICILEDNSGNRLTAKELTFILSDELLELAKIDENTGAIRIADGKVYSQSIVANAILADHIETGQIEAHHIKTNEIAAVISKDTSGKIVLSEDGLALTGGEIKVSGGAINIASTGKLIIDSETFSIDNKGNVSLTGKVTAESGSIGGWEIGKTSLFSGNNSNSVHLSSSNAAFTGTVSNCVFEYGYSLTKDVLPEESTYSETPLAYNDALYNKEALWIWTRRIITYTDADDSIKTEEPELLYAYPAEDNTYRISSEGILIQYIATKNTSTPSKSSSWQTTPAAAGFNSTNKYLWQKVTYNLVNSNNEIKSTYIVDPVIISSYETNTYAIWAGGTTGQSAPFAVTKDGKLYATKLIIRTLKDGSTSQYVEKDIGSYPLWAIWSAYRGAINSLSVEGDTLSISTYGGKSVTFKKAAVNSENYSLAFRDGDSSEIQVWLTEKSSGNTVMAIRNNLSLIANKINSKVTLGSAGSIPVGSVYGDGYHDATAYGVEGSYSNNQYKITVLQYDNAKNGPFLVDASEAYNAGWGAAEEIVKVNSGSDSFSVTVPSETVGSPRNMTFTMSRGTPSASGGLAAVSYNGRPVAQIGISDWWDEGYKAGQNDVSVTNVSLGSAGAPSGTAPAYANIPVTVTLSNGNSSETKSYSANVTSVYTTGLTNGRKLEAESLSISPSEVTSVDYGKSITVTATTTNNSAGKSVTIKGPPVVTVDAPTKGQSWSSGSTVYIVANVKASNGATNSATLSTTNTSGVFNTGWNACRSACVAQNNVYTISEVSQGTLYKKVGDSYSAVGNNWVRVTAKTGVYTIPAAK